MTAYPVIFYLLLAALWWLFFWAHADYRTDLLRFRIFVIRDQLFGYAAQGKIRFDDPAYVLTRQLLNGNLRFAHRLTLSNLLVLCALQQKYDPDSGGNFHARLNQALHGLELEQKKAISDIHAQLHHCMIAHVANVSPLLFPFAWPLKMAVKLHWLRTHRLTKQTRMRMEPIDAAIYDLGRQRDAYC